MRQRSATYFANTRVNSHTLFLCQNDNNRDIRHRNAVKYMRQPVQITGLDQPIFTKVIETIAGVQNMIVRHVDKDNINKWAPTAYTSSYQAIELYNRYFTYRNDDPHGPAIPLGRHIDPTGKLAAMAGNDIFHSEDNVVLYRTKLSGSTK
jgi:hypothetical protein